MDNISLEKLKEELQNKIKMEGDGFRNSIKRGVYKELYKKQMLTSLQINELLMYMK